MNNLLIFFAIPVAVIVFSIALQKILRCPFLVASVIFAILLVVTFAIGGDTTVLVLAIVYTLLSFIVAYLTMVICRLFNDNNICQCRCRQNNGGSNDLLTINTNNLNGGQCNCNSNGVNRRTGNNCCCVRR